ncbi:MAG: glycosyltransferase [Acidobacteriota bacterium]
MRTVLHLRASDRWAGPERHLWELAPGLAAEGFALRPVLLSRREPAAFGPLARLDPGMAAGRPAAIARQLESACSTLRPALVHSHGYKANHFALRLGRRLGLPAIATYHLHTGTTLRLKVHAAVDRRRLRRFDAVIGVTPGSAAYPPLDRVARDRVFEVANGLDVERLRAEREAAADPRRELGLAAAGPVILGLGRLSRQKGFSNLLRAVARIGGPGVLLIAGDGPRRASLEALASALGLGVNCRFLGHREDVVPLLDTADLVVLPSRDEGLPYAALEAMALGTPLVAARVGGLAALLDGGRCGALVPPDDPAVLALALDRLLASPAERRRLAATALERVRRHFSARAMAEGVAATYRRVLGEAP